MSPEVLEVEGEGDGARPPKAVSGPSGDSRADMDALVRKAHTVLMHYLPGASLPSDLSKLRTMLDAHMFGRDKRTQRDDIVDIARQIDTVRREQVR